MNALKPQTKPSSGRGSQKVEYVPPSEEQIEKYARGVCKKLDEQDKSDAPDHEFRQGFTDFMKLAIKIEANHRNPGGQYGRKQK